jgi:Na+-transporting NADH:ubiquinone oxidoreductase subunit B/electron transport complex protein RnfD
MVAVGVAFGVFFGKEVFGGTGRNIFNPALVGRVFLSVAFPEYFATKWSEPLFAGLGGLVKYTADVVTSATPLINYKTAQIVTDNYDLLMGFASGSIGETIRIGIIAGGILLVITKIADWRIPLSYILSVAIFALIGNHIAAVKFAPPMFQLLSGGLLFGAFFMATDPVTSPLTFGGKWIYGILLGLFTVLIRGLSGFVEGVMFAILLMNAIAPLIDTIVLNFKFKKIELPET